MLHSFRYVFLLLLISSFLQRSEAQNPKVLIDSLTNALKTAGEDTNKVKCLNDLAWQLGLIGENEQSFNYANTALELAESLHFKIGISKASNTIGNYYSKKGNYRRH